MSRILLADDSPHAQRMGERILREEGYEVVTVTDGNTALVRLSDVDPDLVLADVTLPGRSGYDVCREIKNHPRFRHVRVVLTAGLLERIDEAEAVSVQSDGLLKKPFEATALLDTIRPLIDASAQDRPPGLEPLSKPIVPVPSLISDPAQQKVDEERVRAAVTMALDAAMPQLVEELTQKVLLALRN